MDINKLKDADFDDIVFDGRNKQYGAYELRKLYWKRLLYAVIAATILVLVIYALFLKFGQQETAIKGNMVVKHVNLPTVNNQPKKKEEKKKEEEKPKEKPKVETKNNDAPVLAKTVPPPVNVSKDALAGKTDIKGDPPIGRQDPGVQDSDGDGFGDNIDKCPSIPGVQNGEMGVGCPAATDSDGDGISDTKDACPNLNASTGKFDGRTGVGCPDKPVEKAAGPETVVDVQAAYKGNWNGFLQKTLNYPEDAQEAGIQGTVIVKYVVDTNGAISDVKSISGPKELRAEAERAVRKSSGQWVPAVKGGSSVKAYGTQKVTFKLEE